MYYVCTYPKGHVISQYHKGMSEVIPDAAMRTGTVVYNLQSHLHITITRVVSVLEQRPHVLYAPYV